MRRMNLTVLDKEGFEVMWKSILSVCVLNQLIIVYVRQLYKYGERERKAFSTEPLMFVNLQQTSFIPLRIERVPSRNVQNFFSEQISRT